MGLICTYGIFLKKNVQLEINKIFEFWLLKMFLGYFRSSWEIQEKID